MSAYKSLEEHFRKINDLRHVEAITMWDEASMMPAGGGDARGQAMSTLGVVIHGMVTDPRVGEWADKARDEDLDDWQRANVREIERLYRESTCLPEDLVARRSRITSKCEQAWRIHRADNNWDAMRPLLEDVIAVIRDEAACRSEASGVGRYDAMLDVYEPEMTSAKIDDLFADLKAFLPKFVEQVIEHQRSRDILPPKGDFSIDKQRQLGLEMMKTLGFDFDHGRLDVSHHPFCGGVPEDVRITTRYEPDSFVSSLMAVIHETGHALYQQGLPRDWCTQPVGDALSSGTHESQSLLMEMQASRTREFLSYMAPVAQRIFLGGESNDPAWSIDNLEKIYTRVEKSYIRVDADEVTYPLHVILRYELEKDLVEGNLDVKDLPEVWDAKMQAYLSLTTKDNFRDGCLQDVHWPAGLIGYFPTYTLGAMTAAQLFDAASKAIPDLLDEVGKGNFAPLLGWLRTNVHGKGKYLSYDDLMTQATGSELDAEFFRKHLRQRYSGD